MIFLERTNKGVPYNLEPYSFKKTSRSFGNTIETGVKEPTKPARLRKKSMPSAVVTFFLSL